MREQVLIAGGGTMGKDISKVFLDAGFFVYLCDIPEKLPGIKKFFGEIEVLKIIPIDNLKDELIENLTLVIEAVSENFQVKSKVLKILDAALSKNIIFTSNTSTFSISKLAGETCRQDKFAGMHFFGPATKMKLVEIIKGSRTSQETLNKIMQICAAIKKKAVVVEDSPGFIVNRLLFAMLNEAFYVAYNNVANIESIDEAMKYGTRHPMGPFALADLIGLDTCYYILQSLADSLGDRKYMPCPILKEKIEKNELGRKTKKGFYEYSN